MTPFKAKILHFMSKGSISDQQKKIGQHHKNCLSYQYFSKQNHSFKNFEQFFSEYCHRSVNSEYIKV